ncbi:MAG TPA: ABC transporter ATP-binding protein [Candidatus Andersenbacteria bacterium]|nr:ABC transporter ATP-binding protein [Candidatus Andersenbacteria bacterium]
MENQPKNSLLSLIRPYRGLILLLLFFTIAGNGLNLAIPKIIAHAIDSYKGGSAAIQQSAIIFIAVAVGVFILIALQSIVQVIASERVARDLRNQLMGTISRQNYMYIQQVTSAKLLTNLTSDVDAVKMFVSQAIPSIVSSLFLIIGASTLMLFTNFLLGLTVLAIVPLIGVVFYFVLRRVRTLFKRGQEAIDWLNKVIHETIFAAVLIRLLNSQHVEYEKFVQASSEAMSISMSILRMFATLIPVITFATNIATLTILALGGRFVIAGTMTLGDFAAFNSYLAILVFPIVILGFTTNMIAMSAASYERILAVINTKPASRKGKITSKIQGDVEVRNVSLLYGKREVVRDVSFYVHAHKKTAIVGPTAAGKTQILYMIAGLVPPTKGRILFDGKDATDYDQSVLRKQVGLVFQDSILFNMSLRANIAFGENVKEEDMQKAIDTAEISSFVHTLPNGLETIASERGTSLSGGQKQRIMLARALALKPSVLVLDDFTARVDAETERRIVQNVEKNYPDITIISVSQKIASIEHYDQIILVMEGELLAMGTHAELMSSSPDYVQIYNSQKSINTYELHA